MSKIFVDTIEPKTSGGTVTVTNPGTGFGKILQAVGTKQGTGTGVSPNANNTWLGTGFGKSITPSSASSKILIICNVNGYNGLVGNYYYFNMYRHTASFTANGSVSGTQLFNNTGGFGGIYGNSGDRQQQKSCAFIDSPNTTSEVYYNVCHKRAGSSSGIFDGYNMDSTIVLLEVSA